MRLPSVRARRCWLTLVVASIAFLALTAFVAPAAHANMAKWWREGELHGPLVPQDDTEIRVDSEDLSFVVSPSLDSAEVTATYRMTNGGKADAKVDVAFVMVAAEHAKEGGRPQASVTIDGEAVSGHLVTEGQILGPKLVAWLAAHPDVEKELARLAALRNGVEYSDTERLRQLVPDCTYTCSDLRDWYRDQKNAALAQRAAREAIPNEIANVQRGWTKRSDSGPISWLTFPLSIAAGASRSVVVKYTHASGTDTSLAVNEVFSYVYFLSPAKRWASFKDLKVEVRIPPDTALRKSSIPLTAGANDTNGTTYRASLATLRNGELTFEVMSKRGLLFGMEQPTGYWILLIAVMALVTIPASARLGRVWARSASRWRVALGCIFGTGIAAFLWCLAIAMGLSAAFPPRAFGNHYGAFFGFFVLLVLFAVAAMAISFVAPKWRKAATPD